jgi:NAD(P)-dependent dehydrogenase (short-subunit alcohol dehydrogenase family)
MTSMALITGANGGYGRAQARQLRAPGCLVAVVAFDAERLADVDADLRSAADTTAPEGDAGAVAACPKMFGVTPRSAK